MAEELQFASRGDTKRKYDDQSPPPPSSGPRRPTGFSAPITSSSPDAFSSYNNNNGALDDIAAAKQKAQAIAARLNLAAEAKRPRLENGDEANDNKGFSSGPIDLGMKVPQVQSSSIPVSYGGYQGSGGGYQGSSGGGYQSGFQGPSKKIDIPNGRVGVIIGKGGETIKYLQTQSGAKIQVQRDTDVDPNSETRMVELVGTQEQIASAEKLITDVLAEAEAGGSGVAQRRYQGQPGPGSDQFSMKVPSNKVGLIIGKGGETIKSMQAKTGARIQLVPLHPPPGDTSTERTVFIDGTKQQIDYAKQLVNEIIHSENRPRNSMGGGYQQGYRPPQQTNWGQPPVQQPGYGYGGYTGGQPQYNMSQPQYNSYPPQQTSSGWDQTTVPPSQQTTQSGGYDYYNQQPQQQQPAPGGSSTPTDNSGYNYGQPPTTNYSQQPYGGTNYSQPPAGQQQTYSQDAYGGYSAPASQSGYAQPTQGYDQAQTYNSAPTYGSGVNSAPEGSAPSYGAQVPPVQPPVTTPQGYASQQPSTTPSYPSQGPQQTYPATSQPAYGSQPVAQGGYGQSAPLTQTSYGPPQGQKPPPGQATYAQTQPPSSQAGYIQPAAVQPGYTHPQGTPTQAGSGQLDSAHRPPPAGFGTTAPQPGYAQPPYGVPPTTQAAYGAQQQQPYGESYAGGYSQPPYSSDGTASGNAHGTYDAASVTQSVQQSAVPKASPQG